jgi:hypothetical protein
VKGIGIVNALEIIEAFPCSADPIYGLQKFADWVKGFSLDKEAKPNSDIPNDSVGVIWTKKTLLSTMTICVSFCSNVSIAMKGRSGQYPNLSPKWPWRRCALYNMTSAFITLSRLAVGIFEA